MFSFVLTGCFNSTSELIRFSKSNSLDISTTTDRSTVKMIKSIIESVEYTHDNLDVDLNKPEYDLWLENNKSESRIFEVFLWFDANLDRFIIFNTDTAKFGYIEDNNKDKIKTFLDTTKYS